MPISPRVLFMTTQGAPPLLAPDQIYGGPFLPEAGPGAAPNGIKTPVGDYDIADLLAKLPAGWRPDLFVVCTDATSTNRPRNLAALNCPAVLIIGDTHHFPRPLQSLMGYASSEPFAASIVVFTRQHAHFFSEAGLERVCWLPGFNVQRVALSPGMPIDIPMSFVGQTGKFHPRRTALCEALKQAGLPIQVGTASNQRTREIHRRSQVSLNCSLNGDLNLRLFEILQSGGFLLTDRLSPEAGLDLLLADGEHLATYDSVADCIAKSRAYLADAPLCRAIAQAGQERYEASVSPERALAGFHALLATGAIRAELDLRRDRRLGLPASNRAELIARIRIYEVVQELHLQWELVRTLVLRGVDLRVVTDISDLARIDVMIDGRADGEWERAAPLAIAAVGLERRIRIARRDDDISGREFDLVIASGSDWARGAVEQALMRNAEAWLIVSDHPDDAAMAAGLQALGFRRVAATPAVFARSSPANA